MGPSCLSLNVFMLFSSFAVYQSPRVGREKQVVDYREWIPGTSAQTNGEVSNTFLFPYTTCIYLLLTLHVNTMAADDLATQGARASTAMVLTMTRCHVCVWCKSLNEVAVLYWNQNKIAANLQTFLNAFSLMNTFEFLTKFYWNVFLKVEWAISQHR